MLWSTLIGHDSDSALHIATIDIEKASHNRHLIHVQSIDPIKYFFSPYRQIFKQLGNKIISKRRGYRKRNYLKRLKRDGTKCVIFS